MPITTPVPSITLRLQRYDAFRAWQLDAPTDLYKLRLCYDFADEYFRTYHTSKNPELATKSQSILLTLSRKPLATHQQEVSILRGSGSAWAYVRLDENGEESVCYVYIGLCGELSKLFPDVLPEAYATLYVSIETTDNLDL